MNIYLAYTLKFFIFPFLIALIMYVLVHFQFLFLHKLLRVELSKKTKTTINILTFTLSFAGVLLLSLIDEYFNSMM